LAQRFGARPFYDIREFIRANIAEAAVVSAPIPVHFGIAFFYRNTRFIPCGNNVVQLGCAGKGDGALFGSQWCSGLCG